MSSKIRVRYAPSPTGHLHIGNARTALFNYLYARKHGGTFVIRIEDTDVKRNVAGGEESQLKYLQWLGVDWDESVDVGGAYGPYRQTERLDLYRQHTEELLRRGLAYRCYCTEDELEREREEQTARGETPKYSGKCSQLTAEQEQLFQAEGRIPSIRFRVPDGKLYSWDDTVKGTISFESDGIGDFVIVKKDGIPTYNYAVVVDDHLMEISHVLRGEDHISNTPRQLMIYEAFKWTPPVFCHMTLIVNEQRKKLSKRDESIIQFIEQYDALGFLPDTLFNFISLLGWSPEGESEMFSKEELITLFDENRLSKSPAVFDTIKLNWLNGQYLKNADLQRLVDLCIPHLQKAGYLPASIDDELYAWVRSLVKLYQDRLQYAAEIAGLTGVFFRTEVELEEGADAILAEEYAPIVLASFRKQVEMASDWAPESIGVMLKAVQAETGYKGKPLFMTVRVALTGQMHGPDLNQTIFLLGQTNVLARLSRS